MASGRDEKCKHVECTKDKQVWLPMDNKRASNEKTTQLKKTPYCEACGVVKSLRIDRAKPIGFYTNVLRDLRMYLEKENKRTGGIIKKLTAVEMRLIIKEMRNHENFEDDFIRNRRTQIELFIQLVRKFRDDLDEEVIRQFIEY